MSNSTAPATVQQAFGYEANYPMAWVASICFSLCAFIHLVAYFRYRSWYLIPFFVGIAMETAGYWTRVVAVKNPANNTALSSMFLLITLAPSLLAAGCYMTFSRMIYWITPETKRSAKYTWIPARWMSPFFIAVDFLAFLIQIIGIFVLIANVNKTGQTPEQQLNIMNTVFQILRVGFFMQIANYALFLIIALHFMVASKAWQYDWLEREGSRWRKVGWVMFGAALLLTGRSVYRALLFSLNRGDNYLRHNEWPAYLFDFLPILVLVILAIVWHPGRFIPKELMTISHGFKKSGNITEKTAEVPAAGYSRVTLIPPPLAPPQNSAPQTIQVPGSGMTFTDPWNNRTSIGQDRY